MSELSDSIKRLKLEGKTSPEIAATLGCSRSTVVYWVRKMKLGQPSRPRTSNRFERDVLAQAVSQVRCWSDLCRALGKGRTAALHLALQEQVVEYGIDVSHFIYADPRTSPATRKKPAGRTLEDMLASRTVKSHVLRLKLIAEGIKEERCESCRLSEWLGRPLSLELDHINGDKTDNRLENLRVLCPNCHSTLSPFHRVPFRYRKVS